jgi:diguanylate cyclase (GGDEF)-like protein
LKTSNTTGAPSLRQRRPDEELILDSLASLVPVSVLQQVQDAFSSILHVPLLFVSDAGGPVTQTSGLEMFCSQLTRMLEAKRPCADCGRLQQLSIETQVPEPHVCGLGLRDVAIPITAGDKLVGYLITSHTTAEQGAPMVVQIGRQNGMAPAAAISYASRIPVESPERLSEVAKGLSALARLVSELATAARQNVIKSVTDSLTGTATRTHFWNCLSNELTMAEMHNYPVSVLLVDLDNFKSINDIYGHETGDKVLQVVGQVLTREIRASDIVARYGSDAFMVMLTCTDSGGADIVSWRLKNKISSCKITARGQKISISASIGQVTYPTCVARDPDSIFKEALASLNRTRESTTVDEVKQAA